MATYPTSDQLLVVIAPVARRTDGESVRIAKDVLSAGAAAKVCLPDGPEEFARMLARRGARRPVVIGDDRALSYAVALLHRHRELAGCALSMVPVGRELDLARSLGVPLGAVAAARAVLDGTARRRDLLVDDRDGVVLGAVGIPPLWDGPPPGEDHTDDPSDPSRPWLRTCQSLVRTLVPARPARLTHAPAPGPSRLRIEVDGSTLVDLDRPVTGLSVRPGTSGVAGIEVRPVPVGTETSPVLAEGRTVTVSGEDFHYRADAAVAGPVRRRTWTVREAAWALTLPSAP